MHFPQVTGFNLERRRFSLPGDLEGDVTLLFLAFWQRHQALVDSWMPLADRLQGQRKNLVAYELPVIQSRSRLSQWFIDSGMRAGIPDRRIRRHTITLYLDKPPFLDALDIPDDRTIQVLVVDRSGRVVWRTTGAWDQEREQDLVSFVDQQIAHRS
ncbi:MAG: hypothetical protein RI637_01650 [Acidimicrobiia bacterium]|nr:hypothetical protein [Acidimicrobiia bacterium]